jgi:hypothetical protein
MLTTPAKIVTSLISECCPATASGSRDIHDQRQAAPVGAVDDDTQPAAGQQLPKPVWPLGAVL